MSTSYYYVNDKFLLRGIYRTLRFSIHLLRVRRFQMDGKPMWQVVSTKKVGSR